ncbi:centromere protein R [Acrasis kona]|uniref:Centromere protein R n=1 Tax=Acrasis kona TaxID=1008807 RepID=A0AAW2ZKI1_9EUKA
MRKQTENFHSFYVVEESLEDLLQVGLAREAMQMKAKQEKNVLAKNERTTQTQQNTQWMPPPYNTPNTFNIIMENVNTKRTKNTSQPTTKPTFNQNNFTFVEYKKK